MTRPPMDAATVAFAVAELDASLKEYARLYDRDAELLRLASDRSMQVANQVVLNFRVLLREAGKITCCLLGGFTGGWFGAIYGLVWSVNATGGVALGITGSAVGGVAGGALGGAVGGAVTCLSKVDGGPDRDVTRDTAWLFGIAAGGVLGGAIGGPLGATGGVLGAATGAIWAVKFVTSEYLSVLRRVLQHMQDRAARLAEPARHDLTRPLLDFRERVGPLVEQLRHVLLICRGMAPHRHATAIAAQAAASLGSAGEMEAAVGNARTTGSLFVVVRDMLKAPMLTRKLNEELAEMRRTAAAFPPEDDL